MRDVVLTQDDIGENWQPVPLPEDEAPSGAVDFRECLGDVDIEDDALTPPAKFAFATAEASAGDLTSVSGATTVLTGADVDEMFRAIEGPEFQTCVKGLAGGDGGPSAFDADALTVRERSFGSSERGMEMTIPFSSELRESAATQDGTSESSTSVPGALTINFVSVGEMVSILAVINVGAKVPSSEVDRWTALLAERQRADG